MLLLTTAHYKLLISASSLLFLYTLLQPISLILLLTTIFFVYLYMGRVLVEVKRGNLLQLIPKRWKQYLQQGRLVEYLGRLEIVKRTPILMYALPLLRFDTMMAKQNNRESKSVKQNNRQSKINNNHQHSTRGNQYQHSTQGPEYQHIDHHKLKKLSEQNHNRNKNNKYNKNSIIDNDCNQGKQTRTTNTTTINQQQLLAFAASESITNRNHLSYQNRNKSQILVLKQSINTTPSALTNRRKSSISLMKRKFVEQEQQQQQQQTSQTDQTVRRKSNCNSNNNRNINDNNNVKLLSREHPHKDEKHSSVFNKSNCNIINNQWVNNKNSNNHNVSTTISTMSHINQSPHSLSSSSTKHTANTSSFTNHTVNTSSIKDTANTSSIKQTADTIRSQHALQQHHPLRTMEEYLQALIWMMKKLLTFRKITSQIKRTSIIKLTLLTSALWLAILFQIKIDSKKGKLFIKTLKILINVLTVFVALATSGMLVWKISQKMIQGEQQQKKQRQYLLYQRKQNI